MSDSQAAPTHDRRAFLLGAGAVLLAACTADGNESETAGPASDASTSSTAESTESAESTQSTEIAGGGADGDEVDGTEADGESPGLDALTPAMFESLAICALAPSTTKGPFPTIEQLDRRDITEGYPGHPLRLGFRVVDATCQPIPGAQVEIWHTDATGDYSSYDDNGSGKDEGTGSTFLRGFQTADTDGIGEFQTIYPGWYEGRAVHIHTTVILDGREVLTTQLYFDEVYTEAVYATGEYAQFGPPDTPWAQDRIIGDPTTDGTGISLVAAPTSLGDGTLGLVNLGVSV